jgi:mannose-6-phosphate isomerase-like protein (cupin superfamily)
MSAVPRTNAFTGGLRLRLGTSRSRRLVMTAYFGSIEKQTLANSFFRKVLFTGEYSQVVLMCLAPGDDLGVDLHPHADQFFRIEQGDATFVFDEKQERAARPGDAVVVPAGTTYNVINASRSETLKLYTICSPPHHSSETMHKTKADATAAEHLEPT